MAGIEATGLVQRFPGGVEAVAGIELDVDSGELFAFLGPNGAGKTTAVRMLTTLLRPTAGSARVGGWDVVADADRVRRLVGVALQEVGLDLKATARELLRLQGRLYGMRRRVAAARADELLELVGLAAAAGRRVGTFSGGMKRRLDLASALVHGPAVLFLDEPTTGLDPASRQVIWQEIRRLNADDGVTVFLTTQYLEEADRLADRVAIIDAGRIVAEGTPERLKATIGVDVVQVEVPPERVKEACDVLAGLEALEQAKPEERSVTLFVPRGPQALPAVLRLLDHAGIPVGATSVSRPSLDDVFLQATGHRIETGEGEPEPDAAEGAST